MRMIDELIVRGEKAEMAKLRERIEREPADAQGFELESVSFMTASESTIRDPSEWVQYHFQIAGVAEPPPVRITLGTSGFNELGVSIFSRGPNSLSDDEYNALLDRFRQFLVSLAAGLEIEARLIPFRVKLERIVSFEAMRKLHAFAKAADKVELDSSDQRRWASFATQVHVDDSPLASEELELWLKMEGWPEESRRTLLDWFEATLSLLTEYDEARVG